MARWLITGGSGFLGINLARHLLQTGHEVATLDKLSFDYKDTVDKVTHYQIDVRNRDAVDRCISTGFDVVVHGAAALPLESKKEIFSTNVDGTRNVLESIERHKVPRSVYISSTAVYGLPDHHPLLETDPMIGVGPYGETKIIAEAMVKDFRKKGLTITTIRPKSFIGPERLGVFAIFYDWAATGHSFPMIGRGKNLYQLLDVEDLCTAIVAAAEHPDAEAVNTEFNIGAVEFQTMREDYQVVLDRAGFGKKIRSSPASLVVLGLEILDILGLSPLYPWVYKTATKDSFVSVEKAEKVLGFVPKYSNKQALIRNFEWYLANKESFESAGGTSHRVPWKQGILGIVKKFY
ncbi:MAG TPA: NAD-dependent epimerase/dehydratase family protein [Myxococcota bacterium]|nr:NAD-dependent epimerase/dehydratase family protein [Myxococcota bacterium]